MSACGLAALARALAADVRAVAEELLDLALVAIWRTAAAAQLAHAQVLREPRDGLPRRVAQREARGLELAVVQAAAVAQLLGHLLPDPHAGHAQGGRGQARPPRRQDRRERAPEQARHLREHEHAVAGDVVDARQVVLDR